MNMLFESKIVKICIFYFKFLLQLFYCFFFINQYFSTYHFYQNYDRLFLLLNLTFLFLRIYIDICTYLSVTCLSCIDYDL